MVYILFYYSQGPRIASLNLRTMEHLFHMQCIMSEHPSCCCCCLSSCPLLQWPCPFIILSLFVPLPLHPTPILTVGHKNPFLRLCVLYVAGNRHIVWDFLSSLSILLHQMPSNKQGLFCSAWLWQRCPMHEGLMRLFTRMTFLLSVGQWTSLFYPIILFHPLPD